MSTQQINHRNFRIAEALSDVLADSYVLSLKTQNYHWNVTGPQFHSLHTLFDSQYQDLATAVDEIAERIRTLGEKAPGSYREFSKRTKVSEATGEENASQMVGQLRVDHEALAERLESSAALAEDLSDCVTADLLIGRASTHQKQAWMLRSTLG